jgi:hypothetical protein
MALKPEAGSPKKRKGWGVRWQHVGNAVHVGIALRRKASNLVKSGQARSFKEAAKQIRSEYW